MFRGKAKYIVRLFRLFRLYRLIFCYNCIMDGGNFYSIYIAILGMFMFIL